MKGSVLACLGALALPSLARATSPVGEVNVDCTRVEGWAHDPDDPAAKIAVHLYFDGPAGDPAATGIALTADLTLQGACVDDPCSHGFRAALPLSRFDGAPHPVHAYGIDGVDPNLELALSPATYTCPPLPIVAGVKRHIASPDVLTAWQLSIYFDMMKVADIDLAAVPEGVTVDAGPQLVVAEGTSDPLWLLDQGTRRAISPEHAAAWRFAAAAAAPMPGLELMALPEGTPLSQRPVLAQGTGPKVYLLDDLQCAPGDPNPACPQPTDPTSSSSSTGEDDSAGETTSPPDTDTDTTATGGPSSEPTTGPTTTDTTATTATTATTSDGAPEDDAAAGCDCHTAPRRAPWLLLLLPLAWRRRSRRA